jgi:hypothetical protein
MMLKRVPSMLAAMSLVAVVVSMLATQSLILVDAGGDPSPRGRKAVADAPSGITITGVDAHDGTAYREGDTYYLVGSKYGCGFRWLDASAPWCGFAVYSATALGGPWTFVRLLFDPASMSGVWKNESWQTICRGDGCFNPRMAKRPDGVWVLWFNAPRDYRVYGANSFWGMGCNGPAGPCGGGAGPPYGSTTKPSLWRCNTGGDFSLYTEGADGYLVCGTVDHRIRMEKLQPWWVDGTGIGLPDVTEGRQYIEGVGMARMPDGTYVITFGNNCPYCAGTDTSYAYAPTPLGPWKSPSNPVARAVISGHSCGGQPRTLFPADGVVYEWTDAWDGGMNQTAAAIHFEPMIRTAGSYASTPDGSVWRGAFEPFQCQ